MNYIGSKKKLSSQIKYHITNTVNNKIPVFCDMFSGTGIIARVFNSDDTNIICNDLEYYSYILNKNYITNTFDVFDDNILNIFDQLNNIPTIEGFITEEYAVKRMYFSIDNAKKIDTIRQYIENHYRNSELYYFLLSSLLESADKVANTTSVYGSYLKKLKKTALKQLIIKPSYFKNHCNENNDVYKQNANDLIQKLNKQPTNSVIYLDPPYNHRQYSGNYHLLNTICEYKPFMPIGKTGQRPDNQKSDYCSKCKVYNTLNNLIKNINGKFDFVFMSYNNEGLLSFDDIKNVFIDNGFQYKYIEIPYKTYKSDNSRNNKSQNTIEYLHIGHKNQFSS